MNVRLISDAWREYENALRWYEQNRPDHAARFMRAVEEAVERIQPDPLSWELLDSNCRRVPVQRFPYSVIFQVRSADEEIVVVAVAHGSREPGYWRDRVREI